MKELFNSIDKKEWHFVFLMIVILILITGIPYLVGYLMAEEGFIYNGIHALSPGDTPVYYSYINQIRSGDFLVKNLFTFEVQGPGTFNIIWFLAGSLAKILGLSVIFIFQLYRLLWIPIFVCLAYFFISYFFTDKIQRKVCLIFLLFSSGLGIFFISQSLSIFDDGLVISWWPIDLWISESITFNSLYQSAHFIASISFEMFILLLGIFALEKSKLNYAFAAGILALIYFNFHPYYLPVIYGVLSLYLFVKFIQANKILWKESFLLIIIFFLSIPSGLYHFWLIKEDPVIAQRALQNVTHISPLFFVIVGYGFLWAGFFLGIYFLFKNKKFSNKFIFLAIWFLVNVFLIYSPFPFHSRYTQGLHVILVIFTVSGIFDLRVYFKSKFSAKTFDFWINNKTLLTMLFLFCFMPTTLFHLTRDFYYFIFQPEGVKELFYQPKDFFSAHGWLGRQEEKKVVLGSKTSSLFIPGFSRQAVYAGHGHETLFYYSKLTYVYWFFSNNDKDEIRKSFLRKNKINYIFYSDYERGLGEFKPSEKEYLQLVYENSRVEIYEVIED